MNNESTTKSASEDGSPRCAVAPCSASGEMTDDPQYQAWVESMAKHCRCRNGDVPCAGVLAGGICDDMPDPWEGEDCRDEEDREGGRYY